jgi:HEAT repeat protein
LQTLREKDEEIRESAAHGLASMRPADKAAAISMLVQWMSDKDWNVREAAATGLGQMGSAGKTALPALKNAIHDQDASVRDAAVRAVAHIEADSNLNRRKGKE